jgi:hypothetical protein
MVLSSGTGVVIAPGRVQTSAPGPTRAARRAGSGLKASEWRGWPSAGRRGIGASRVGGGPQRDGPVALAGGQPAAVGALGDRVDDGRARAQEGPAARAVEGVEERLLGREQRWIAAAGVHGDGLDREQQAEHRVAPGLEVGLGGEAAGLAAALLGVGVGARARGLGLGGRGARALGGEVGGLLARAELEQAEHAEREDSEAEDRERGAGDASGSGRGRARGARDPSPASGRRGPRAGRARRPAAATWAPPPGEGHGPGRRARSRRAGPRAARP